MTGTDPASPFVSNASLWPPRLVSAQSAWNEHIPFAGWIVEATQPRLLVELGTHTGVSYFAFCESVLRLELDARCYAVDTWLGDEQAGHYDEDVYRAVQELNSRYYESFSRLLRGTFEEALSEVEDSSVDLLHLDGLHSYEAVRGDFETWLPKLSPRALVLIHDINERKEGFGVHGFFDELTDEYDTFEFTHGHGLGVVAVGPDQPEALAELMKLEPHDARLIRGVYEMLGRRISGELSASVLEERIDEQERQLQEAEKAVERGHEDIREITDDAALRMAESDSRLRSNQDLRDELVTRSDAIARLESELASSGQDLRRVRGTLKNRTNRLKAQSTETKRQEKRVEAIESSTSWRLTAPVRFVADRSKALFRIGRRRRSLSTSTAESIYEFFDERDDAATRRRLSSRYRSQAHLRDTLVSIVMPTHNRSDQIGDAIGSVLAQTHANWELIIVDDGSVDDTAAVVSRYTHDDRVRYDPVPWAGVSRARNTGLDLATGSVIAFLDSDNRWDPGFLELMLAALDREGVDIAYSGLRLVENGEVIGYRGRDFDYEECLEGNFVDLNVLCHRRSITDDGARFDETLRRMVDWDYLLSIAKHRDVAYEPFLGADYTHHSSEDQISEKEPRIYRRVVESKHTTLYGTPTADSRAAFRQVGLTFAIRIAAPREGRDHWGDYHYATGLAQALERKGHSVRIKYYEEELAGVPDVVISLRGLTEHEPLTRAVNVVWSISHPDLLSWAEIDGYDLFFSASLTWPEATRWSGSRPAHVLPQATDRARFFPSTGNGDHTGDLLFVGNSRKAHRPMVSDAAEAGLPLAVYGRDWEGRIPPKYIKGDYLPNDRLTDWYGSADGVLNDHWDSMREYGYVSNRIFDVIAAGGSVLSDHLPSIPRIFGDAVVTVSEGEKIAERYAALGADDRDRNEIAIWALRNHSFDDRAERLLAHIEEFVLGMPTYAVPAVGEPPCPLCNVVRTGEAPADGSELAPAIHVRGETRRLRVGLVPQPAGKAVTSSAFIRLVQPLTSEIDDLTVSLARLRSEDPDVSAAEAIDDLEAIVVSRTAFDSAGTAKAWIDAATDREIPIVLDTDDAFHLMDETHPEFGVYREKLDAYSLTLEHAAEVWCSSPALAKSLAGEVPNPIVVPNSIDPRLWRQYRKPSITPVREGSKGLQIVYAGTATHGGDFAELMPILDDVVKAVPFQLTVVGIAEDLPERRWLRRLRPGRDALYPRYARWLLEHGPLFDVGVAPLADTEFNRLKSDIKLLEYLAIGVIPLVSDLDPYSGSDTADPSMLRAGPEEWADALMRLGSDRAAFYEAAEVAHHRREVMWATRNAAKTGATMANRLADLVDRSG